MLRQEAGDLGGEIDALRRTLALSPAWGLASRRLSIALERHNDTAQAEQTLRRAIRLNPADAFNHGWLGDLFWRSGRHEEALVALEDALCHDPSYEWAWDQLHAWSLGMRRESRAIALAAQLTTARQGESSVWLRLVRLRFDDPAPEGNLAALDRAEALDPRDPDVHDLRADLLARHRRWAEALRACRPPIFGTDVPHTLLGREAWVRAASGRRQEAIEAMQAVLARHPDYVWGLSNLVEWLAQAKRHKEAIEAAKRWAWLAPDSPAPRGWIGSSQRALGEVREARATYERALERFPDYLYAAHELLDIHLEARDFPAAERVARQIGQHGGQAEGLRARALVERRRGGWKQTAEALAKLARMPDASGGQLRHLAQELAQSGKQALARGALAPALRDPAAHREVAGVWLEAARPLDLVRLLWAAWRARSVPPHRQALVTGVIDQLAERRSMARLRLLRLLAARPVRDNPEWWGEMGYAFTYLSRWRSALRWMHDWREREHLRPYMLSNIALCHFQLGRPGPALEAVRRGLEHPPTEIRPKLSGWLAVESALAGDLAAAEEALADSSPGPNQHFDQALHALARRLVAFERLGPAARKEALREELDELAKLETGHSSVASDAGMRRHFRRARMRAAWLAGSAWERFMQRVRRGPAAARERETAAGFQFNWLHYLVAFLAIKALIAMLSTR